MVTITCKIPAELNKRLEAEASRKMLSKSALVREALDRYLKRSRQSAFDRVEDLCGIIKDGPTDMSTNPKYMDGFAGTLERVMRERMAGPFVPLEPDWKERVRITSAKRTAG